VDRNMRHPTEMRGGTLRQCIGKGRLQSVEMAENKIKQIQKQNPDQYMRWYYCGICNRYHLTSKRDPVIDKIRAEEQSKQTLKKLKKPGIRSGPRVGPVQLSGFGNRCNQRNGMLRDAYACRIFSSWVIDKIKSTGTGNNLCTVETNCCKGEP